MSTPKTATLRPDSPLTAVRGIGPVRERALQEGGFHVVGDLLWFLPFRYEDRRRRWAIEELEKEGPYTLCGRLRGLKAVRLRRRGLSLVRGRFETETGGMPVIWFNRPYITSQVDEETEYLLHGVVRQRGGGWELVNPSVEAAAKARLAGSVVPVYSSVGQIAPSRVRAVISGVLDSLDLGQIPEELPDDLRERYDLPPLGRALDRLHRPSEDANVEDLNRFDTTDHHRLIYGEMLRLQLELALVRRHVVRQRKSHSYATGGEGRAQELERLLPFQLTAAQSRAVGEILGDMRQPYPMMRLLQGDVGSGKTAVAAMALGLAAESGLQSALMAPTELLAEQHHAALCRLLGDRYPIVLLTSSTRSGAESRAVLESAVPSIAVGTHALIQDRVRFQSLGLVIIDEQHRFGVGQRRDLQLKGDCPDLLVMTATPIPRSLTLTVYGDLALSIIDEMPPGRTPVATSVVAREHRDQVYTRLAKRLEEGARAYVVLPLIDTSETIDAESIGVLGLELANRFAGHSPAILHGRLSQEERFARMRSFALGDARLLIATTLVEVGIDVPEATIMIIESAERFGLSQLHQLRGRVGRGGEESFCVAIHGSAGEESSRRLQVFASTTDGFRVAEEDLAIRGPGDILGTRQSGLPSFRIANLVRDRLWIERARQDAERLVESDPRRAGRLAADLGAVAAYERLAGA